jgi:hypothetical protein
MYKVVLHAWLWAAVILKPLTIPVYDEGTSGIVLAKTLLYKPEGRGFDSRKRHGIFCTGLNSYSRTMAVKSALRAGQPAVLEAQEDSWHTFLLEATSTPGP